MPYMRKAYRSRYNTRSTSRRSLSKTPAYVLRNRYLRAASSKLPRYKKALVYKKYALRPRRYARKY